MKYILALSFLLCQTLTTTSFVLPNTSFTTSRISNNKIQNDSVSYKSSSVALPMSIDALNVESMSTDHEKEGSRLAASIAVWLDTEVRFHHSIILLFLWSFFSKDVHTLSFFSS